MDKTDILAVVVSFNGGKKTLETIDRLKGHVGRIQIVDNASSNEDITLLKTVVDNKKVFFTQFYENKGIGVALNHGIDVARENGFDWLLTMDQDSLVSEFFIDNYCLALNENSNLVCLTPNISINGLKSELEDSFVDYAITSGNLVRMNVFDDIGPYNEELFIDCIDFDFSLRLRNAGHKIKRIESSLMVHELGEARKLPKIVGRFYVRHSPVRRYYMFRNLLYMIEMHSFKFPFFIAKLLVTHVILFIFIPFYDKHPLVSFKFVFQGLRDYFFRRMGVYSN